MAQRENFLYEETTWTRNPRKLGCSVGVVTVDKSSGLEGVQTGSWSTDVVKGLRIFEFIRIENT